MAALLARDVPAIRGQGRMTARAPPEVFQDYLRDIAGLGRHPGSLRRLAEHIMTHAKHVDVAGHEGFISIPRRVDDRVPAQVEAGVDDQRATCLPVERLDQPAIKAMPLVHRLEPGGVINVRDGGHV